MYMVKKALPRIDIEKLIDKGAPVKEENKVEKESEWTNINIRIPRAMLNEIDEAVKARIGLTRTGWVLESFFEKLKRTKKKEE
jgi:hypothetical protein